MNIEAPIVPGESAAGIRVGSPIEEILKESQLSSLPCCFLEQAAFEQKRQTAHNPFIRKVSVLRIRTHYLVRQGTIL